VGLSPTGKRRLATAHTLSSRKLLHGFPLQSALLCSPVKSVAFLLVLVIAQNQTIRDGDHIRWMNVSTSINDQRRDDLKPSLPASAEAQKHRRESCPLTKGLRT
jgi:hypothetical protein